jgi:hypothetical protein
MLNKNKVKRKGKVQKAISDELWVLRGELRFAKGNY